MLLTLLILGLPLSGHLVPVLGAQQPGQPQPHQQSGAPAVSAATLAAQLQAAATADTQALVVGPTDFTRYTTPTFCLIAAQHALTVARRSLAAQEVADTIRRHYPERDTLPASVAPLARACAARFPVAKTAPDALPDLFELALLGQQDALAAAVVTRRAALAPTPAARAAVLSDAVQRYVAAAPARVAAAEALVPQVDALGAGAAILPGRLAAHQALLALGDATSDWPRVRREAEVLLTLLRPQLSGPSTYQSYAAPVLETYRSLILLAALRAPDSLGSFAQQLQQDARRLPVKQGGPADSALRQYATAPADSVVPLLLLHNQAPTPPLEADFWFPAKDTTPPGHGQVTLYVELPEGCYDGYTHAYVLAGACQRTYTLVQSWAAQYGRRGLAITLVASVVPQLGGTVLSGPQTPAQAASNLRWYFLDYLKLPVQHVAVQVIPVAAPLPAPDGRIFPEEPYRRWSDNQLDATPFQRMYHARAYQSGGDPTLVLTGRDGRYWYGGGPSVVFDRLLTEAMLAPAVASPAAPAAPVAPTAASARP